MVTIRRTTRRPVLVKVLVLVFFAVSIMFTILICLGVDNNHEALFLVDKTAISKVRNLNTTLIATGSSLGMQFAMKDWRKRLYSSCQAYVDNIQKEGRRSNNNITEIHLQHKEQLEITALDYLSVPDTVNASDSQQQQQPYKFCQNVFIDLGTNRGDTIAASIDSVIDVCTPTFLQYDPTLKKQYRVGRKFPHPHFDATNLPFKIHTKGYKGFGLATKLQKYFGLDGIDNLCVYGVEGNPHFTSHLRKLEATINSIKPKPLQHLKILTETVVSSKDGSTTLYVDQFSEKNHFWGSSLIKSMPDVQKTAERNNGRMVEAKVAGVTLSTLLLRTLSAFKNPSSALSGESNDTSGGSLLVKMDIEGKEYSIIKEVAASGVLCEYVARGNNATILVEYHGRLYHDKEEKLKELEGMKEAREKLKNCGVQVQPLPNFFTG